MNRTKIEWTDYAWNPIKGLCPNDCWYCYAKKIYERFGWNTEMKIIEEYPEIIPMQMYNNKRKQISRKVFVCSTFELFHPEVPKLWRDWIFDNIKYNYHLTFQILTKFPQNIDRPMPNNVWLGVTVTMGADLWRIKQLMAQKAIGRFVSYEPFLHDMPDHCREQMDKQIDWLIIGRLTGHGRKCNPSRKSLIDLVGHAKRFNVPIFLKNNLEKIWGEPLIQEFPQ